LRIGAINADGTFSGNYRFPNSGGLPGNPLDLGRCFIPSQTGQPVEGRIDASFSSVSFTIVPVKPATPGTPETDIEHCFSHDLIVHIGLLKGDVLLMEKFVVVNRTAPLASEELINFGDPTTRISHSTVTFKRQN
jgi:hypothetical protein